MKVHVIHVSVARIRVNKSDIPKTNAPSMKRFVNVMFSYTYQKPLRHSPLHPIALYVSSIHHILSLVHSPHSIMWRIAMNQRRGISESVSSILFRDGRRGCEREGRREWREKKRIERRVARVPWAHTTFLRASVNIRRCIICSNARRTF